jgi:hypothetical protein
VIFYQATAVLLFFGIKKRRTGGSRVLFFCVETGGLYCYYFFKKELNGFIQKHQLQRYQLEAR